MTQEERGRWCGMRALALMLSGFFAACAEGGTPSIVDDAGTSGDACSASGAQWEVHHIQGLGAESEMAGERVTLCGVVSALASEAMWVETLPARRDDDPRTSDAIRVEPVCAAPMPALGDVVRLEGMVEERAGGAQDLPETLLLADAVQWLGELALPHPASADGLLDAAVGGASPEVATLMARYESLEGTRLRIEGPVVVGPTRGGTVAIAPTALYGRMGRTLAGGLPSEDGALAEPILVEVASGGLPALDVGDLLEGAVEGVVFHRDGRYRLRLTAPLPRAIPGARPTERAAGGAVDGLTLATMNLARLHGADAARLDRMAQFVAGQLAGPDILALQEVADPAPEGMLASFAEAVRAHGGPDYDVVLQSGNVHDFGPLRLALLAARGRAEVVRREGASGADIDSETLALVPSPGAVEPEASAFSRSRIPLAVELCALGKQIVVIVVHLSSRLADDPLMGPRQPPVRPSAARRLAQAERVAALVARAAALRRGVVVLGDFNDTPGSSALSALQSAGLRNLADTVPVQDRYSYVYEGASSLLDHVLVSSVLEHGSVLDVVHGSSDRAETRRDTDHDPLVARVAVDAAPGCVGL